MAEMAKGSLMRAPVRFLALVLVSLAVVAAVVASHRGFAQSSGSPADLLQLFQNLTPEQQDAIMKQFGLSGGGGAGGIGAISALLGGGGSGASEAGPARQGARNRKQATGAPEQGLPDEDEIEEQLPGLKGNDWVVLQVAAQAAARPAAAAPPATPPISLPGSVSGGTSSATLAGLLAASAAAPPAAAPAPANTAAEEEEANRVRPLIELDSFAEPIPTFPGRRVDATGLRADSAAGAER